MSHYIKAANSNLFLFAPISDILSFKLPFPARLKSVVKVETPSFPNQDS